MGVRVGEFHSLSAHAPYVPQQVAMQLQLLWDSGNQLVSLLDEGSWRALTELEPAAGLQVCACVGREGGTRGRAAAAARLP